MVIQSGVELRRLLPDAEIRIPVSGPFSIASNLVGFEPLLCDAATDGDATVAALSFIVDNQLAFCREIARAGLDATFFDSAAAPPLLSPRLFEALVLPSLTRFVGEAAAIFGHRVACVIGGDTYPILELLLKSGTGYVICPSETDQTAFMARMRDRPDVTVRINMEPGIIARGISEEVFREVDRVARLVTCRPHTLIGTGVLPFETRPDVVMKVHEYVLTL
jgi:uroporphyrinogen-III decarboxylase